jgi:peptidoglycan hydrolase CwlO-like protein
MKKQQLVQIPVGHVCLNVSDVLHQQTVIDARENDNAYLRHTLYAAQDQVEDLKKRLSDANEKISGLKKDVNEKQDRVLYWYQKYTELADKLNAVKPDAETKEA